MHNRPHRHKIGAKWQPVSTSKVRFFQLKESVLRKQSLYLKFDPLLRDSPKKKGPDPDQAAFPVAALLQHG